MRAGGSSEPPQGLLGHLPYHFLVVHTGYDVSMIFIRDSELRSQSRNIPASTSTSSTKICRAKRGGAGGGRIRVKRRYIDCLSAAD